jgi:hypothetical protein
LRISEFGISISDLRMELQLSSEPKSKTMSFRIRRMAERNLSHTFVVYALRRLLKIYFIIKAIIIKFDTTDLYLKLISFNMDASERKKFLIGKLREAGTSDKKMHVISRGGKWIIVNEASNKAVGVYRLRQQAVRKAQSLLYNGSAETVIFHNRDGSISRKRDSHSREVEYASAE